VDLSAHRIASIDVVPVRATVARNIGRNAIIGNHGDGHDLTVLVVTTDRGATGWGPRCWWNGHDFVPDASGLDGVIGRSLAELFDPAIGTIAPEARPLDIALHDLVARILDVPVYAMLGGAGSRDVALYSGAVYFDDLDPEDAPVGVDAIRRDIQMDTVLGHRDFKLKIGRGHKWMPRDAGMARDIEVTRRARELAPNARIMVDSNTGYSVEDAEEYLRAVADCDLYWLEEPLPENEEDFRRIRAILDEVSPATRLADGESAPDTEQLVDLGAKGLLGVAQMDVVGYGITLWREVMPRFAANGVDTSPHTWGNPVATHYAAHLAAGLGNVSVVEAMPAIVDEVDASAYTFAEGILRVPDAPGFGLRLR
jgi:D-galactarolactone cycloisomerase